MIQGTPTAMKVGDFQKKKSDSKTGLLALFLVTGYPSLCTCTSI